jgi:YHS domain-containing protein
VAVFGQDPEVFLAQESLTVRDPIDGRTAVLDPGLRTYVNYEVFFFAETRTKAQFVSDPGRWCGLVTDPVSRRRFRPAPFALQCTHGGRTYFFESDSSLTAFKSLPDSFAIRKGM